MAQLIPILPWIALALAAILLLYSLLGDALRLCFRRTRRCPKCWYDLSATPGRRCSECGHEARSERRLHRFRRRWGLALIALLIAAGGERAQHWPDVQRHGWGALIPATALMVILELQDWPSPGTQELVTQELLRRWRAFELSQRQEDLIRELALRRSLHYRSTWVEGVPWRCSFVPDRWLMSADVPVSMTLTDESGVVIYSRTLSAREQHSASLHGLSASVAPELLRSGMSLRCEVGLGEIDFNAPGARPGFSRSRKPLTATTSWSHTVKLRLKPDIHDILTPVHSEELTRIARESLRPVTPTTMVPRYSFHYHVPRERWPEDIAFGADIRIYRDGELKVEQMASSGGPGLLPPVPGAYTLLAKLARHDLTQGEWIVRVTANPRSALHNIDCDRYWAGEFEIPLLEVPDLLAAVDAEREEIRRREQSLREGFFGEGRHNGPTSLPERVESEDEP